MLQNLPPAKQLPHGHPKYCPEQQSDKAIDRSKRDHLVEARVTRAILHSSVEERGEKIMSEILDFNTKCRIYAQDPLLLIRGIKQVAAMDSCKGAMHAVRQRNAAGG